MIVKFSLLGMLIVLVAVLVWSMKFRESFLDAPVMPPPARSPPQAAAPAQAALPTQAILQTASPQPPPQAGVFAPSQPSDVKSSTLVPPTLGAAGPAPVAMQPVGSEAVKNQSDLLANIQKVIRNELLANRSTDASVKTTQGSMTSPALMQGRESKKGPSGVGHAAGCTGEAETCTCDQSQYIKKDSIPCWGCALDY